MNILVIEDDPTLARSLAAGLTRAGHRTEVALGGHSGLDRAKSGRFDVIVTDWMLPEIDGPEIVREVRLTVGPETVIILMSGLDGPLVRAHASRVGADAFLPKPVTELALNRAMANCALQGAGMGPKNVALEPLTATQLWRELPKSLGSLLSDSVGLGMTLAAGAHSDDAIRVAMSMLDAQRLIELELCVFASAETGQTLAKALLRQENADPTIVHELMKEICNNLLGGLKTSAASEGFDFTLSLEDQGQPRPANEFARRSGRAVTYTFTAPGIKVSVCVGVRAAQVEAVKGPGLRENMILAEDLHNDKGILVVPRGTRLTALSAERVARHVPNRTVRVCMAAKPA